MTTAGNSDEQPPFSEEQLLWLDLHWGDRLQAGASPRNLRDPHPPGAENGGHVLPPPGQPAMQQQGTVASQHMLIMLIIRDGGEWSAVRAVVSFTDSFRACQPRAKLRDVLAQSAADGNATSKEGCRIPKPARLLLLHSPSAARCRSYHSVVCCQAPVSRECLASIRVG